MRFKKIADPEALKKSLKDSSSLPGNKPGKLAAVGNDFLRWEWKYSFTKPKAEELAKFTNTLRDALRPLAPGFDGKCQHCSSSSTPALTLMNGMPSYICPSCQQRVQQEMDQADVNYQAIEPNYPNGLVLGIVAALLGGRAWGLVAYGINRIFL